ncbi:unnamed protein product [Eruca vesicaria subsp. sativa]|uniref:Uncharacterized protein n=1 Tax=Eruca vesicaria subsp. sativa TaxID=29727 RepID=A0ABC8IW52_ERUVS|nr:unnamed protein product [Eruca vesicaria subsp. sativa]
MIVGEKGRGGSSWSRDDDIAFESALAIYIDETDNRWEKIARVVSGKTLEQVIERYKSLLHDVMKIESGDIPLPDYDVPEDTNVRRKNIGERSNDRKCENKQEGEPTSKPKRRKVIPWTPLEHSQFLLGLEKYGKGDWRSISRHVVLTRTPTQVASHAQKYYERLKSKNSSRQRQSIQDFNVAESTNISAMKARFTWQDAQANSQPSLDHPTIWNTQATSQSIDHHVFGKPTIWNMQAASLPPVNVPFCGTHTIGQSMVGPKVLPTIGQSMVGPKVLPHGTDMNLLARSSGPWAKPMPYGVQHHSDPYSSVPYAPFNRGPVPYTMTNIHTSR